MKSHKQGTGFFVPLDIPPPELQKQPLQRAENKKGKRVALTRQKPSDSSYEAHKRDIRKVLSHYRVLTNDGWHDPDGFDNLVEDLAKLNKGKTNAQFQSR